MERPSGFAPSYWYEDKGRGLFNVAIVFLVLQTFFLVLFLVSRSMNKTLRGIELWLVASNYLCGLAQCVLSIIYVTWIGVGKHTIRVYLEDPSKITNGLKIEFAVQHLWIFGITLPKLVILRLYLQIFVKRFYRRAAQFLLIVVILNCVVWIIGIETICRPYAYNWDKTIPGGKCSNLFLAFKICSGPNIAIDLAMLILPIPMIWNLHTDLAHKTGLTIIFVFGSFGLVTAIIRLYEFCVSDLATDITYYGAVTQTWVVTETACYFIAAVMLNLGPLWQRMKESKACVSLRSSLASLTRHHSSESDSTIETKFERQSSRGTEGTLTPTEPNHNHITVTHAYKVESQKRLDDAC